MVSWVSLLMGIFSSWLVPVTSRPLVHSPLGGWRGCPSPHSAPPRAAGGSGSGEKAESFRPPKRPARRRRVFRPLTLRGDAPNGGDCAMGPPEAVYQGLASAALSGSLCPVWLAHRRAVRRQSGVTFPCPRAGESRVHARGRDQDGGASRRRTATVGPNRSVRSNQPIRGVAPNRGNRFITSDRGVIPVWLLAPFDLQYGSG